MRALTLGTFLALVATLFGGMPNYASAANELRIFCPEEAVEGVDSAAELSLEDCRLAANANDKPQPGEVTIVVVVGDRPVDGLADYELLAYNSYDNGIIRGAFPTDPVPDEELIVGRGDLLGVPATCVAVIFYPGDVVPHLPNSTWQLERVWGGDETARLAIAEDLREKSTRFSGGDSVDCPWVEPEELDGYSVPSSDEDDKDRSATASAGDDQSDATQPYGTAVTNGTVVDEGTVAVWEYAAWPTTVIWAGVLDADFTAGPDNNIWVNYPDADTALEHGCDKVLTPRLNGTFTTASFNGVSFVDGADLSSCMSLEPYIAA